MKNYQLTIISSLSIAAIGSAYANDPLYLNWIRQTQSETNEANSLVEVVRDNYVDSKGTAPSITGVSSGGAVFDLYTLEINNPENVWLLDTALAGTYLPKVEIEITAADSFSGVARTRADQPFSVRYEISGLLNGNDPDLPESASKVSLFHYVTSSENGNRVLFGNGNGRTLINDNGTYTDSFVTTNITSADPSNALLVAGKETFVVEVFDGQNEGGILSEESVLIYPVPSGHIDGLKDGENIALFPDSITMVAESAYPGSEIYLEITTNYGTPNEQVNLIPDAHRNVPNDDSYSFSILVDGLTGYATVEGETIVTRLISNSVFGAEILAQSTNTVSKTIEINGSITSSD